jgi:hypothetical protein
MVAPFARSNGGSNSSVTVLIAVETNALISAARAAAVAASSAIRMTNVRASVRMPILTVTEPELEVAIDNLEA